jgi:hypothetical protein
LERWVLGVLDYGEGVEICVMRAVTGDRTMASPSMSVRDL